VAATYCYRCNVRLDDEKAREIPHRRCLHCGATLPPPKPGGRLQDYCHRACRDAAYYRRHHGKDWEKEGIMGLLGQVRDWEERYEAVLGELREAKQEIARLAALVEPA
jgi:hypothetical protein